MDETRYDHTKDLVIEQLTRNPESFSEVLYTKRTKGFFRRRLTLYSPIDKLVNDAQLCCLINRTDVQRKYQPPACNMAEIAPMGSTGKVSIPYTVTIGNNEYVMKQFNSLNPRIFYSNDPPTTIKQITDNEQLMRSCLYKRFKYSYIGCDSFTNEMLISYILETAYSSQRKLNGFMFHIGDTICASEGINIGLSIMNKASEGTLGDFFTANSGPQVEVRIVDGRALKVATESVVLECISQVISNLHYAQSTWDFNHGDMKVDNILVSKSPTNLSYENISMRSGFRFMISDFDKSSITINTRKGNVRIYNDNPLARKYLWLSPFKPRIGKFFGETYYVISSFVTSQIYALSRHMGFPFYLSFDVYTFFVSLFSLHTVYNTLMISSRLRRVWDVLFFDDDKSEVFRKLTETSNKGVRSIADAIYVLKNIKLKCNASQIVIDVLGNI